MDGKGVREQNRSTVVYKADLDLQVHWSSHGVNRIKQKLFPKRRRQLRLRKGKEKYVQ